MVQLRQFTVKWRLNEIFGIDPRSLALFRASIAVILLVDLVVRLQDFRAMYTEEGILPLLQAAQYHKDWRWSLNLLSSSTEFQASLFALAGVCALALLVGYRTRLAVILTWMLVVSLHVRMPLVLNAGDAYLRLLLFWSMFLPLGEAWSLDARRRARSRAGSAGDVPMLSAATVGIVLQVCIVYWYAGLTKLNQVWLAGDAMDHVLRYSMLVKPPGEYLLNYPDFLTWITKGTLLLEIAGPFLLFIPWRWVRPAAIAAFAAFHLGIELTLYVGQFAFVSLCGLTLFLPRAFWTNPFSAAIGNQVKSLLKRHVPEMAGRAPHLSEPPTSGRLERWARRTSNAVCPLFLIYLVGSWDFSTLRYREMPAWLKPIGNVTMLPQAWGMYHTAIPREHWYIYKATLRNGRMIDILPEGVLTSFEPTTRRSEAFPNHRWRKIHTRLVDAEHRAYRQPLAEYMYRRWNDGHGEEEQIELLEMFSATREVGRNAETKGKWIAPFARVAQRR